MSTTKERRAAFCLLAVMHLFVLLQGCSDVKPSDGNAKKECSVLFGECAMELSMSNGKLDVDKLNCLHRSYPSPSANNALFKGATACVDAHGIAGEFVQKMKPYHYDNLNADHRKEILAEFSEIAGTIVTESDLLNPGFMAVYWCGYAEASATNDCSLSFGTCSVQISSTNNAVTVYGMHCSGENKAINSQFSGVFSKANTCGDVRTTAAKYVADVKDEHYTSLDTKQRTTILGEFSKIAGKSVTESDLTDPNFISVYWCGYRGSVHGHPSLIMM